MFHPNLELQHRAEDHYHDLVKTVENDYLLKKNGMQKPRLLVTSSQLIKRISPFTRFFHLGIRVTILIMVLGGVISPAYGQQDEAQNNTILDVPFYDFPFNNQNVNFTMSMRGSLSLIKDFYHLSHYGIQYGTDALVGSDDSLWGKFFIILFDLIPFPNIWLHEEWHRAVLTYRNSSSVNDWVEGKATHIKDEDLIRLKGNYPADQVRLAAAGIEVDYESVLALEKDAFFYGTTTWNFALYWLHYIINIGYLYGSASHAITDDSSDALIKEEGGSIEKRDALGFDGTAWVYDLHRPNEPYQDRGLHPSGLGIDRYIKFSDLNDDEKNYLRLQAGLSLLNLLDPHLFGYTHFGTDFKWNATLRHHLTSFGYVVDLNLFFKRQPLGVFTTIHNYHNEVRSFWGLDVEIKTDPITLRMAGWDQPEAQGFKTARGKTGGSVGLKFVYPEYDFKPYAEVEGKTEGWVAGNVYLDSNVSLNLGMIYSF